MAYNRIMQNDIGQDNVEWYRIMQDDIGCYRIVYDIVGCFVQISFTSGHSPPPPPPCADPTRWGSLTILTPILLQNSPTSILLHSCTISLTPPLTSLTPLPHSYIFTLPHCLESFHVFSYPYSPSQYSLHSPSLLFSPGLSLAHMAPLNSSSPHYSPLRLPLLYSPSLLASLKTLPASGKEGTYHHSGSLP